MSLFGFAVGSPFRPIGQQGKLIRQLSGTQRVTKTTRRSLRKIITTTYQLNPCTTMAMENFGLNISFLTKQYLSASALHKGSTKELDINQYHFGEIEGVPIAGTKINADKDQDKVEGRHTKSRSLNVTLAWSK